MTFQKCEILTRWKTGCGCFLVAVGGLHGTASALSPQSWIVPRPSVLSPQSWIVPQPSVLDSYQLPDHRLHFCFVHLQRPFGLGNLH